MRHASGPAEPSRPAVSLGAALVLAACVAQIRPTQCQREGHRSVLFILFDDLRVVHEAYGQEQAYTPHTNALAARSLVFDRAFVQQAVCGPSRASLLTGRRPDVTRVWDFSRSWKDARGAGSWYTLPGWFKKHGYYTAGTGKLFHDAGDHDPKAWTEEENLLAIPYHGQGKCPYTTPKKQSPCPVNRTLYPKVKFPDEETLADAKRYLQRAADNPQQPFWIAVGFTKPHMPIVYPAEFTQLVALPSEITLPENMYTDSSLGAHRNWGSTDQGGAGWQQPLSNTTAREYKHAYLAAAASSDHLLGELLNEVDRLGLANTTLIFLTSDHGWGLGEHNHWFKYTNWETDTRVPLIIHDPDAKAGHGVHSNAFVELVDLYPTMAQAAGIPVPADVDRGDGTVAEP